MDQVKGGYPPLIIFLLQTLHILSNMSTEDILLQRLSIKLLALRIIPREPFIRVRNEDSTVRGTLERTEYSRTSRCALETDIEVGFERSGSIFVVELFGMGECAIWFSDTFVFVGEAKLSQSTTSDKETGSVSCGNCYCLSQGRLNVGPTCSPVCQSMVDTVSWEFV